MAPAMLTPAKLPRTRRRIPAQIAGRPQRIEWNIISSICEMVFYI
jgi:hypothetical protein